jgi:acyl carrier protein
MLDAARLLPSDDFTGNLRFVWRGIDDWADVEIVEQLEKRFEISVSDSEAANCKTVSDLIYLVAGKLHPHE